MNQFQLTHGHLPSCICKKNILKIKAEVDSFLENSSYPSYISGIDKKIPRTLNLISEKITNFVKLILHVKSISLENVELHYLPPSSEPIPPHQDNFYHCIEGGVGMKILVPLTSLSPKTGGLLYLNCPSDIGILTHKPSAVKNFSSYIEPHLFQNLEFQDTAYTYSLGDASYHLLNSVHYSHGNCSHTPSMFLVFRFQDVMAKQSKQLLNNYLNVYAEHKRICSAL